MGYIELYSSGRILLKIDGDYIITKMTIPLTYNGTMSISASKAAERLI